MPSSRTPGTPSRAPPAFDSASIVIVRISNVVFAVLALTAVWIAARRIASRATDPLAPRPADHEGKTNVLAREGCFAGRLVHYPHPHEFGSQRHSTTGACLARLIILLGLAAALGAALGMREFSNILGPVFLALVLSITVHPVRRIADRHRWPAWVGIILSLLAVYGIVAGLFFILISRHPVPQRFCRIMRPNSGSAGARQPYFWSRSGLAREQLQKMVSELSPGRLVGLASSVLGGIAGVLSDAVFLIVLLLFTVADAGSFASKLEGIMPRDRRLAEAFGQFAHGSRQYLAVATIFGAIVATCDVVALVDSRYPLRMALGPVGIYHQLHSQRRFHYWARCRQSNHRSARSRCRDRHYRRHSLFRVEHFVIQTIIQPRVVGNTVGAFATLSFLSLIIWATILGASGAFLAIPLSLFVQMLCSSTIDPEHDWVVPLLSSGSPNDKPTAPSPDAAAEPEVRVSQPKLLLTRYRAA